MKASHKTRLFLITTASVGAVLAILFVSIVLAVKQKVLAHKESEMRLAVRTAHARPGEPFDLGLFHRLYPGYRAAVFDDSGRLTRGSDPEGAGRIRGFVDEGSLVRLGEQVHGEWVVVTSGWTAAEHGLDDLALVLGTLWLPLTLLVGAATWLGAHSVFRPLERLSQQADSISGSRLGERLAIQDRAEFGAFAGQLNRMLDRIEETVAREEEFASDAAHELRTPLAILRTRVETTLLKPRSNDEYVASHEALLDEIERLTLITESLLRSARGKVVAAAPLELEPILAETIARWSTRFAADDCRLEARSVPARACLLPEEFRIILDNLLANALRFSPSGSVVRVDLREEGEQTELTVEDEGPGIPADLREKVFERFYRAEESRNRESGGAGIGLSVCRRILESRGGSIRAIESRSGACIVCRLPSA